ncbi:uncharacterized protein LOC113180658 [Urocitellus parryii]|uniref:tau-tubulin kinase 1-like n=1 Tax=Urocitellus parryii TaxID=9999 RepID=UPI000E558E0A|nr:tau-tubulin kinase 1-like [Urocitellus parryii]XP_026241565.1 tau-tubulin kinase 1-like [Urocitellus parryii]
MVRFEAAAEEEQDPAVAGSFGRLARLLFIFRGSASTAGFRPRVPPGAWPGVAPPRAPPAKRRLREVRRPGGRGRPAGEQSRAPLEQRKEPAPSPCRARPGYPEPR